MLPLVERRYTKRYDNSTRSRYSLTVDRTVAASPKKILQHREELLQQPRLHREKLILINDGNQENLGGRWLSPQMLGVCKLALKPASVFV
ncbi:unnamed protein product [Lasius platythorax]|uniref:Uncharacterized protein n=1 Tax=Lasius platythorax TaxID=488582 RepID=A0AAV2N595_9HYME